MSKQLISNIILLALWVPFFANNITSFFNVTPITNKIILLEWIISLYCVAKLLLRHRNPPVIKNLLLFAGLLTIYAVLHMLLGEDLRNVDRVVPKEEYFICIVGSLYPVFLIYYLATLGYITENHIRRWSLLFLIAVFISYPNSVAQIKTATEAEQFTNNIGYTFLQGVPLLLFWYKRPVLQYVMFIILGVFIMNALKRGPIMIWLILFVILLFQSFKHYSKMSSQQKIVLFLLPIFATFFGFYYFNNYLLDNQGFMNRLNSTLSGDDSGRGKIYSDIFNVFLSNSNAFQLFLGHGAESTIKYFRIHAHNDWLELLINQGIIGALFYFSLFKSILKQIFNSADVLGRNLLINVGIMVFITSIFSMSYMAFNTCIHLVLGYAIYRTGQLGKEQNIIIGNNV